MLREVVEAAVGNLQPSPTFKLYRVGMDATDGQSILVDKSGNKVDDTDRAPFIFSVFDEYDITKRWNPLDGFQNDKFTFYAAHCFMIFITQENQPQPWTLPMLLGAPAFTKYPPQGGLAIINIDNLMDMKFVKDGLHSVEAIPIVREALLKVFPPPPPPPPPSQDKDQTQQGEEESKDEKEEKTRTRRSYILLVVITLIILLGLIGGVVYMAF
jgi:hypothetical protein